MENFEIKDTMKNFRPIWIDVLVVKNNEIIDVFQFLDYKDFKIEIDSDNTLSICIIKTQKVYAFSSEDYDQYDIIKENNREIHINPKISLDK